MPIQPNAFAHTRASRRAAAPLRRSQLLSCAGALLCMLALGGCLRVRETFELAPDLSGRVVLEAWVPRAFLPSGAAGARLRLGSSDLILPAGVELRRHEVTDITASKEVRFELALSFHSLEQLAGVALRFPGSREVPSIFPWRGIEVRRSETKIEIERRAYGTGEISAELLASRPEGRLAAGAFRTHSSFAFERGGSVRWIAPSGGWRSERGSAGRRWYRVRSWGEQLRTGSEPLRALLPLSFAERSVRLLAGALRGFGAAAPWIALALWLHFRRPRHFSRARAIGAAH